MVSTQLPSDPVTSLARNTPSAIASQPLARLLEISNPNAHFQSKNSAGDNALNMADFARSTFDSATVNFVNHSTGLVTLRIRRWTAKDASGNLVFNRQDKSETLLWQGKSFDAVEKVTPEIDISNGQKTIHVSLIVEYDTEPKTGIRIAETHYTISVGLSPIYREDGNKLPIPYPIITIIKPAK